MTHATTATSTSTATAMGNVNKKNVSNSLSVGDLHKHSAKITDNKDVAKWSSTEVHNWIKEQCKRFDLKKATVEKFQMNGEINMIENLLCDHYMFRSGFSTAY
jgi:glutamyl/glutaminyl-tRNA synthetase